MTLLVAGMMYGVIMLAAGVAIGEALAERRYMDSDQLIHDEWDAACKVCSTSDMPQSGTSGSRDA